ncbi:MAG: leucine--tRNA ligase [Candidatus Neomarinimicrobiota bacterium]|nr:leucine--tRNA ligase [Candidatus Neomarinimicrobiota bacterium]
MLSYNHKKIEPKWQEYWANNSTFLTSEDNKPKYYVLDMFPYPSGSGLHVGHALGYVATDIVARFKRMKGFNVLHPMGWDAFGLPAEQYAIKTGTHPSITTAQNIQNFKRQINQLGFSYDWSREINTTDPEYYKWTQWIFLQLYNRGLAYQEEVAVNWCPELRAVLANEEVVDGKSDIGGHPVYRTPMKQWVLKITKYAESLLNGLEDLDWPENIKELQKNWIGKSEGVEINFSIKNSSKESIKVYTTRSDTLFGATYMVIAPEHPLVDTIVTDKQKKAVEKYIKETQQKSDFDRTEVNKDKTGIFTGSYAINPLSKEEMEIWVADYVLISYGTGAIMAVPGHDERDWEFAKKYDLPIKEVVKGGDVTKAAFIDKGDAIIVNSSHPDTLSIDGLTVEKAIKKTIQYIEKEGLGTGAVNYKLRDWLFSRQRYWGEPFPIIHTDDGLETVKEEDLPVMLPEVDNYKPSDDGKSPLSTIKNWVEVKDSSGNIVGLRETNTMPQWAGSCWYYLRFVDPLNRDNSWSEKKEKYWMPVDLYIGGQEHAVLHLLYSRFWHHVLHDLGLVSTKEPFKKLYNQGMILGDDGAKMSKSRGNVVNPDDIIDEYGADSMRLYEMFMGPLNKSKPWNTKGLQGCYRFINKLWAIIIDEEGKLSSKIAEDVTPDKETLHLHHTTIKKVGDDIENLHFNTAVSQLMIYCNHLQKCNKISRDLIVDLVKVSSPFMPHLSEEFWSLLGNKDSLAYENWPDYDEKLTQTDEVTVAVQVNGKLRANITLAKDSDETTAVDAALALEKIENYTSKGSIVKTIYVPNRLLNFVVK